MILFSNVGDISDLCSVSERNHIHFPVVLSPLTTFFCISMKTLQNIDNIQTLLSGLSFDVLSLRLPMPLVARNNGAVQDAALGMG